MLFRSLLAGNKPTKEIVQKAVDHAKQRIAKGKDVFAQKGEQKPLDSTTLRYKK